jgi:hypothetical protein
MLPNAGSPNTTVAFPPSKISASSQDFWVASAAIPLADLRFCATTTMHAMPNAADSPARTHLASTRREHFAGGDSAGASVPASSSVGDAASTNTGT